jgi:hypothetical protein
MTCLGRVGPCVGVVSVDAQSLISPEARAFAVTHDDVQIEPGLPTRSVAGVVTLSLTQRVPVLLRCDGAGQRNESRRVLRSMDLQIE